MNGVLLCNVILDLKVPQIPNKFNWMFNFNGGKSSLSRCIYWSALKYLDKKNTEHYRKPKLSLNHPYKSATISRTSSVVLHNWEIWEQFKQKPAKRKKERQKAKCWFNRPLVRLAQNRYLRLIPSSSAWAGPALSVGCTCLQETSPGPPRGSSPLLPWLCGSTPTKGTRWNKWRSSWVYQSHLKQFVRNPTKMWMWNQLMKWLPTKTEDINTHC